MTIPAVVFGALTYEGRCAVLGVEPTQIDFDAVKGLYDRLAEDRAQAAVAAAMPHVADPAAWVATRRKIARELRQRLMTEGMTLADRAAWAADAAYLERVADIMERGADSGLHSTCNSV